MTLARKVVLALLVILICALIPLTPAAGACPDWNPTCSNDGTPTSSVSDGQVIVGLVTGAEGAGVATASNPPAAEPRPYRYRLTTPCAIDDAAVGGCLPGQAACPQADGRVVGYYVVQRQRLLVEPPIDAAPVPEGTALGQPYGGFVETWRGCVDVTELNPAPTPAEVFAYFQTLPLPQLATSVQPPGGTVLVGLPTIFFTDAPTQQVFTVDIRGFQVVITAAAQEFAWHTGDGGAVVTSAGPGAPYPNQTVTYDYTSGTYSTYVTVTWGGTFTVNGSAPVEVGGTTTTDGPAVQLTAVQARAELVNPYD